MASLLDTFQKIIGEKIFGDKVTFEKDVVFKQHVTSYQDNGNEPSWGDFHTKIATLYDGDPTTATEQTITVSDVPAGAKGVYGYCRVGSATTAGRYLAIRDSDSNNWAVTRNISTSLTGYTSFIVPLNSNRQFKWAVENADVNDCAIYLRGYWK